MDPLKQFNLLSSNLLNPEEINFILSEPSIQIDSSNLRNTLRAEALSIIKKDETGILLLPFKKSE